MNNLPATVQRNLPAALERQATRIHALVCAAFDASGFNHRNRDGSDFVIRFDTIALIGGRLWLGHIDTQSLWHFSADKVESRQSNIEARIQQATNNLPARIIQMDAVNSDWTGIGVLVDMRPEKKVELPTSVSLPIDRYPLHELIVPIGITAKGHIEYRLEQLGNILVGGTSRFGKTNWIKSVLTVLRDRNAGDVEFVIIDAKGKDFRSFNGTAGMWNGYGVITDLQNAIAITEDLIAEMNRRFLDEDDNATRLFVVVDELIDFIEQDGIHGQLTSNLLRLASKGLGAGIQFVFGATSPDANTVRAGIKKNCNTRIAFQCMTAGQSLTIIEERGAESLPNIKGRFLARLPDRPNKLVMGQAYYVEDEVVALAQLIAAKPKARLTVFEARMVVWAVEHNAGKMSVWDLFEQFGNDPDSLSANRLKSLLSRWEEEGLLEYRGKPRFVTTVMEELARSILADQTVTIS